MSELKAFNSERIYWAVEQVERAAGDIDTLHLDDSQFYLKSEADKVIEELKEKRDTAEKLLNKALDCVSNSKNHMMSLARKKNHADYKRCLAMARIAQDDWHLHNSFYAMGRQEFEKRKCEFYEKWHKRWLELADKFKEEALNEHKHHLQRK